jgi:hypothetical protein
MKKKENAFQTDLVSDTETVLNVAIEKHVECTSAKACDEETGLNEEVRFFYLTNF